MRNAKKTNLFWVVVKMAYTICLTSFIMTQSCASGGKTARTDFELVKADKYFVPLANETVAILFDLYDPITDSISDCNVCFDDDNNICYMRTLFGDKKEAEKIIGKKLKPMKLIKGREWLEKIMDAYNIALKEAEERNFKREHVSGAGMVFVTRNKGYIRGLHLDVDNNVVYDEYMESALLKEYFKELGIIPPIPRQADKYFVPPKDETVAIALYSTGPPGPPVALFGDKKLGEKTLYGDKKLMVGEDFEPERVFKGRKWLEKIIDAYEVALKQAKEDKKEKVYQRRGSIVFLTRDEGYIRGIDVGEDTIYDDVTESNLLKAYFDKLGLTKKLLAARPPVPKPRKYEFVFSPGEYYVPPAGETAAILLYRGLRNINTPVALFGDKELTEKIMGRSLKPKMLFEDRNLLKKIMDTYRAALKEAEESHFERDRVGRGGIIRFVTPTEGYVRTIGIDENTVHDDYMESTLLKKHFDELGLTDELLSGFGLVGARKYCLPPTDKVVSVLLYPQYIGYSYNYPAAIFGDRKLTEKLLYEDKGLAERLEGKPLEPRRTIEGREWLEKIMDAYRNVLKEAEEKKLYHGGNRSTNGRIIFVTAKNGYEKFIGVDANTVYDKYMESEMLKKYFDELGITDEMGRSEFDIDDLVIWGDYYVPPTDETTAILLYSPYNRNLRNPFALIGDKKLTEKIMGISLEPKMLIEGRDWLVKMMDAFDIAFKNIRDEEPRPPSKTFCCGEIIFITRGKGYAIARFKASECDTYYEYMGSGLLKTYFDELGLTKELLVGEPNAVRHPQADKTPQD